MTALESVVVVAAAVKAEGKGTCTVGFLLIRKGCGVSFSSP